MAAYKKFLLVYLDILGFRDLIDKSKPDYIERILQLTKKTAKFGANISKVHKPDSVPQIRNFSDLIIRATPMTDDDVLEAVDFELMALSHIQSQITCAWGVLLRGGITMGDLQMDGGTVFGPALVRAYHLEKELAVYPRIVIDSELIPHLKRQISVLKTFRTQGDDGVYFVNYLLGVNWQLLFRNKKNRGKFDTLNAHRRVVAGKLKEFAAKKDERLKQKAIWMALYHNSVVKDLAEKAINEREHEIYLRLHFSEDELHI